MSLSDEFNVPNNSDQKEIINILLDPDKINLATEFNETEVLPLAILEAWAKKPLGSSNLKIELDLILEMVKAFKINRISLKRQSRKEIIEGWLGAQVKSMNDLKDRVGAIFKGGM